MTTALAIATTSDLAAQAGAEIARAGGNAVDAAIAASLVSINTEPGVCSLGCGGYITVWPPGHAPITLDGYVAAPGKGSSIKDSERVALEVHLEYGGGITTVIGPDSVGVPGAIALFGAASERYGNIPWHILFDPAIDATRRGFPLPEACYNYLVHSGELVFGRSADGYRALHHADGQLKKPGESIHVPYLSDTLARIAAYGPEEFYTGEVGHAMSRYIAETGGRLSEDDLASYQIIHRPSLVINSSDNWKIATNPPPAIGGTVLAAMLQMINREPIKQWDLTSLKYLLEVQRAALGYRRQCLDVSENIDDDAERLLKLAITSDPATVLESASTCHTSAVDATGLACAITVSAGYGAGDMPPGSGIWLNNCVGELELNKRGLDAGPPGTRLPSNMAPTTAINSNGTVMAIGSPGADRITTAILQTLINHFHLGMPVSGAIDHPRCHVEFGPDGYCVAYEAGLPIDELPVPSRKFDAKSMYFGGVGAAVWSPDSGFTIAADSRRSGGTWHSG
jgi:gamma-glutamyltranspeptidase/glutathione hydrolase